MTLATALQPIRIQRSRKRGSRLRSPNALPVVIVSRPSPWGNPFRADALTRPGVDGTPLAVKQFEEMLLSDPEMVASVKAELRGVNLACWCALDKPCHADVLLRIANEESGAES